ncbi:Detected protein of unknown function [Hibiscus syriacus]|uniref:Growth-regulating factor n=1 Tax=Hibiscus syriacus TaxID=106335 RepID=A0A6A2XIL1_HIBSY|nr:Detected protein of unknown function [Hibiscus syriacus]
MELYALFLDADDGTSVPSWIRVEFDFDPTIDSPTVNLRNNFNLLSTHGTQNDFGVSSSSMPRHSCVARFDFDLNMPPTKLVREQSHDRQTPAAVANFDLNEAKLFRFEGDHSDEEPIREPSPDGDELCPFYKEPEDLDMPPEAEDNEEYEAATTITHVAMPISYYQPPSHFTIIDMEALNALKFSQFPHIEQYNQRSNGDLYIEMVFRGADIKYTLCRMRPSCQPLIFITGRQAVDWIVGGHQIYPDLLRKLQIFQQHYNVIGIPVPPDLIFTIKRSFLKDYSSFSSRLFSYHAQHVGCNCFKGIKIDPKPGRCRRTDGKNGDARNKLTLVPSILKGTCIEAKTIQESLWNLVLQQ